MFASTLTQNLHCVVEATARKRNDKTCRLYYCTGVRQLRCKLESNYAIAIGSACRGFCAAVQFHKDQSGNQHAATAVKRSSRKATKVSCSLMNSRALPMARCHTSMTSGISCPRGESRTGRVQRATVRRFHPICSLSFIYRVTAS